MFFIALVIIVYKYSKFLFLQKGSLAYQKADYSPVVYQQEHSPVPLPPGRDIHSLLTAQVEPQCRNLMELTLARRAEADLSAMLATRHSEMVVRRVPSSGLVDSPLWEEQSVPRPAPGFAPSGPSVSHPRPLRRSLPPDYGQRR